MGGLGSFFYYQSPYRSDVDLQTTVLPLGIHWFRRDLRVAGNAALEENILHNGGRVLGLFCLDKDFLSRADFSPHRFAYFLNALESLQKEMRALGGDLLVIEGGPQEAFPKLISVLKKTQIIDLVSWNRDYEPSARARDKEIKKMLADFNIDFLEKRDHLLIEPEEIFKTKAGDFYQVYTPFAKKWFVALAKPEVQKRISSQKPGLLYLENSLKGKIKKILSLTWADVALAKFPFKDQLKNLKAENDKQVTIPIPKGGSLEAYKSLKAFAANLKNYKADRDRPALNGTSHFSLYLKNGTLTSAQIIQYLKIGAIEFKEETSASRFLKEIVWREFYYSILFHRPDVETQDFLEKFRHIKWPNDKKLFKRWCEGNTGVPLVDAGMRQLNTTGWMHNRVRMVVASFLCKDLLIDWRWGENYFMKMLLDGDMAPNNGGWQWSASTGCDPQPEFRIFNPWLQGAKFDPEGKYIKLYIPELKNISPKNIHNPDGNRGAYVAPIVDHGVQKKKALLLFKARAENI